MKYSKEIIKKLISYFGPHKKLFIMDLVAAFLFSGIELVFPMFTRYAMQTALPNGMILEFFLKGVPIMLGLYILMAGFSFFMNYYGHIFGVRVEADMRNDLFTHLNTLSYKFFDKKRVGKLMSRLINDLFEITEMSHHGPEDLFISGVMMIGSFVVLCTIEYRLALIIYLVIVPLMILFSVKRRKKLSEGFRKVKENTAVINADAENAISGIRVVKSFANEEYEIDKFKSSNSVFVHSKNNAYKQMAIFMVGMNSFINILNITVLVAGCWFIYKGTMDYADLTAFLLYINLVLQPIRRLTNFTQQFEQGMTGFSRFYEILQEKPDITEIENPIILNNVKGDIKFDNASFYYNQGEDVLKDIDIDIKAGTTVAVVGPSGGGKTTLCHLIPRFYELVDGSITIDDINIKDIQIKSLRQNIGLVQQNVFIFSTTIKDNIKYGNINATDEEIIEAAKKAEIHDFITSLPNGYDTFVGEKGIRLSGGQKQRVSIARIFLKNPPILILDEATSALDNETEIKIQKALEKLSVGRTSLIIAHRLSTIRNADNIIVLDSEGIQESGSHNVLYNQNGIYTRLYNTQFREEDKA